MTLTQPELGEEAEVPRYSCVHLGDPMPWPRAGARIAGKYPKQWIEFYTPAAATKRSGEIAAAWRAARHGIWPAGVPLALFIVFAFARPSGHYGTGRNASTVKPQFLGARPGKGGNKNADGRRTGGDLDNCVKQVLDALSEVAFADDGQLAKIEAEKLYVDQAQVAEPQTIIELRAW